MSSANDVERLRGVLAAHCSEIGREASEIIVSEQTMVVIGATEAEFETKFETAKVMLGGFADVGAVAVAGTPERVIAGLRAKMDRGVTDFAVMFGDLGLDETLALFAREVMPAFR